MISNNVVYATSKASDQPVHTHILIRTFACHLNILTPRLLKEQHLEFLNLKGDCTGWSESTLIKMPHCWKLCRGSIIMSHRVENQNYFSVFEVFLSCQKQ